MKKILAALMLCAACETAFAQTAEELLADGKNTENVTTFGMGYDLKMYSPLKQINKSNVKRLVLSGASVSPTTWANCRSRRFTTV